MAPTIVESQDASDRYDRNIDIHFRKGVDVITEEGILTVSKAEYEVSQYKEWLPTWNPREKVDISLTFSFHDRAFEADPEYTNLFKKAGTSFSNEKVTPKLGSIVTGVQLSQLDDAGKNDLALFVAERGVVAFRGQDLKNQGLQFNKKFGEYFGPLHVHPSSGAPHEHPWFHIVYRRNSADEYEVSFDNNLTNSAWHADCTYEKQPPGITFFAMLEAPEVGGDTLFLDTEEAYNRLSPLFKSMLENLQAVHSSESQAAQSRSQGSIERRPPVTSVHPLVRTHIVTGRKSLFLSPSFMTGEIRGLKSDESKALLNFLTNYLQTAVDLQARFKWEPDTVVVWDNRRVLHTGIFDWETGSRRHAYRISPMAEAPF